MFFISLTMLLQLDDTTTQLFHYQLMCINPDQRRTFSLQSKYLNDNKWKHYRLCKQYPFTKHVAQYLLKIIIFSTWSYRRTTFTSYLDSIIVWCGSGCVRASLLIAFGECVDDKFHITSHIHFGTQNAIQTLFMIYEPKYFSRVQFFFFHFIITPDTCVDYIEFEWNLTNKQKLFRQQT